VGRKQTSELRELLRAVVATGLNAPLAPISARPSFQSQLNGGQPSRKPCHDNRYFAGRRRTAKGHGSAGASGSLRGKRGNAQFRAPKSGLRMISRSVAPEFDVIDRGMAALLD